MFYIFPSVRATKINVGIQVVVQEPGAIVFTPSEYFVAGSMIQVSGPGVDAGDKVHVSNVESGADATVLPVVNVDGVAKFDTSVMTFTQEVVYMFYEYYSDDSLHRRCCEFDACAVGDAVVVADGGGDRVSLLPDDFGFVSG